MYARNLVRCEQRHGEHLLVADRLAGCELAVPQIVAAVRERDELEAAAAAFAVLYGNTEVVGL